MMNALRYLTSNCLTVRALRHLECAGIKARVLSTLRERKWHTFNRELRDQQSRQLLFDRLRDCISITRAKPVQHQLINVKL